MRNARMYLFTLELAHWAWNNDDLEVREPLEHYYCRICGKRINPGEDEVKLVPGEYTHRPDIAKKESNGYFVIHGYKCIEITDADMVKNAKVSYRSYVNRKPDKNIIKLQTINKDFKDVPKDELDDFLDCLSKIEMARIDAKRILKNYDAKGYEKASDSEIEIFNKLRLLGVHLRIASKIWQEIRK